MNEVFESFRVGLTVLFDQAPRLQRYDAAALQNRDALQVNLGTALLTGGLGGAEQHFTNG